LATPSVLDHLFNQLCPGYSKEPHTALNHIRQTYDDTNSGKPRIHKNIMKTIKHIRSKQKKRSRTPRNAKILPPLTAVISTMQTRSAFGSKSFSKCLLPSMPPALVHQSPASLVAPLLLLLVLDVVVDPGKPVVFMYNA
jgi:hypothetical protein